MTYLTDMKDFKQPFPTEVGTTFVSVQYNEWTKQIIRECRIWLYDSAFIVAGVDFTNIDFYQNKGFLKWTVRPCNTNSDLDNVELGVCDYYKYFQRSNSGNNNSNPPSIPKEDITLTAPYMQISQYQGMEITAISEPIGDYQFLFEGDTMSCTLRKTSNNTCMLKAGREIGIVTIKAVLTTDTSKYGTMRIVIN